MTFEPTNAQWFVWPKLMYKEYFLTNGSLVDPVWPRVGLTFPPSNALGSGQGFFWPNLATVRHSEAIWRLTPNDTCKTFDRSNVLCPGKGLIRPNLVATGHSWAMWPLIDPRWPYMTCDPSNVLHSSHGFSRPNLVPIGHSYGIWPQVDPGWPLRDLWLQHSSQGFFQ